MKRFSSTTRVNSRHTSRTKKRIGLIVIVSLLALFLLWFIPRAFAQVAALVFVPIEATKTWLFESTGSLPHYLRDRTELIKENKRLEQEIATLSMEGGRTESLRAENEELRALLGESDTERILAGVIGRPNALPYDVLIIDQGFEDGVLKDAPVYIGEDRVIGIVAKTFARSAVIELVTTPGLVTSVFVVGPDIYTNAVGIGSGQMRIGVPQGIEMEIGNSVILPSVTSGVFGSINHIESFPTRPEQYGYVSTDIPIQSLRLVSVGKTPLSSVTFEEAQSIVADSLTKLFTVPVPEGVLVVTDTTSTTSTSTNEATSTTDVEL